MPGTNVCDEPSASDKQPPRSPQAEKAPTEQPAGRGVPPDPPRRSLDEGSTPHYADGTPASSNSRAIADYHAFESAEGRPPASLTELRAWIRRQT